MKQAHLISILIKLKFINHFRQINLTLQFFGHDVTNKKNHVFVIVYQPSQLPLLYLPLTYPTLPINWAYIH